MKKQEKISIVIPCYNEEESLPSFYTEIKKVADNMKDVCFEFIFVNDGSKDKTLDILRDFNKKDKRCRYISFSRNFFKEAAMLAGLEASTGDYIAIMDADLQDPPSLIPLMYKSIKEEGYDCVASKRASRKGETKFVSFCSNLFYIIINKISDTQIVNGARDFRLMTREMVNAILELKEYNRFSKGIFSFVGFDTKWIAYDNLERIAGTTKINFRRRFSYALEGIISFSTKPLILASIIGILLCFISFVSIVIIIVKTLIPGNSIEWKALLACIMFFISGIQLFCTGILGQYLAKTHLEAKNRPLYIIKETEKSKRKKYK